MERIEGAGGALIKAGALARRLAGPLVAACLASLLAACGGRDDSGSPQLPVVMSQPADQSVVEGSAAAFTVSANGAAPLAYQWAGSPDGTSFTPIAGATNPSYSTGTATVAENGMRYRVTVSNAVGSTTSSTAHLTVTQAIVAPAITVQPADQAVTAPATATFHATATGTSPSYQWQLSTDAGASFAVVPAPDAPSLVLSNTVTAQDGSLYRVVVSNSAGSVTSSVARLTVSPTPMAAIFTTQPTSQSIMAGQAVDFSVVATGTPTPTIGWRINTALVVSGPLTSGACAGATVAGASSSTLTLTAVPLACSGALVDATAFNGVSPAALSNSATLTVNPVPLPPIVTSQPADASVVAPASATFTATAGGVPTPTLQWQQSTDGGSTFANITGATNPSYTTPATTLADNGKRLRAVFSNASGSATSNAALLTLNPAAMAPIVTTQPGDVTVSGIAPWNVTFSAAASGTPTPTVQWQTSGDGGANWTNIFGATDSSYSTIFASAGASGQQYRAVFSNSAGTATSHAATFNVTAITPALSLLAGDIGGPGNLDGTGAAARFWQPAAVAADGAGNVYVADMMNNTVRKITPAGVVSTLAGTAFVSGSADGTGAAARFTNPSGIAVDGAGNVYVADTNNCTIRAITPAGVVSTLAGTAESCGGANGTGGAAQFYYPQGLAVDGTGNVYVADGGNNTIRKVTSAGVVTTLAGLAGSSGSANGTGSAARFFTPTAIALDAAGNLFVADANNQTIRKVTPAGVVTTFAGTAGNAGTADGTGAAAQFQGPWGIAIDAAGNLFISDSGNNAIRKITPAAVVTTFAGVANPYASGSADGTGAAAQFNSPFGATIDAAGNLYVADYFNSIIRKITPAAGVTTFAGLTTPNLHGDGTGGAARFLQPEGVAVDAVGNTYVAERSSNTIRKITSAGVASTLAGLAGSTGSGDGTGSAARFNLPYGIAVDAAGNLYVGDSNNHTIRKITPAGAVSTLAGTAGTVGNLDGTGAAAQFNSPTGVAVDAAGNVYVADEGNGLVRMITPAGVTTTLSSPAGAGGTPIPFSGPYGVAVDAAGNVYVAEANANTIDKVTPAGVVTTLAGLAGFGGSADGTGSAARFNTPISVAVDTAGNVYVADYGNSTIRKITPAGVVTTVVGAAGEAGIRLGSSGRLYNPPGVAVIGANKLAITSGNAVLTADVP